MSVTSFKDTVVLWASEDDPAETGPTYDAVDAILDDEDADIVYQDPMECTIVPVGEMVGGETMRGANDGKRAQFIKQMAEVNITLPLRAFAGDGEAPFYDAVLRAANFEPEVDNDDVIYTKKTVQTAAMTVYKFQRQLENDNWRLRVATGVRGSLSLTMNVDEEPMLEFSGTGQYAELQGADDYFDSTTGLIVKKADGSGVTARTGGSILQADQDPMTCTNMVVDVDGGDFSSDALLVQSLELDTQFEVVDLTPVQGATTRRRGILMRGADGHTSGSLSLVDYDEDIIDDIVTAATQSTEHALSVTMANGDGQIDIDAPKLQFLREEESGNGGVVQYDLPIRLNGDWGTNPLADNEITITYSPSA